MFPGHQQNVPKPFRRQKLGLRKIGLSREKPQYLQILMHSLLRYSGAYIRTVRPKCRSVVACERCAKSSRHSEPAGEINAAKPAKPRPACRTSSSVACRENR
jgi:hypothetical protein